MTMRFYSASLLVTRVLLSRIGLNAIEIGHTLMVFIIGPIKGFFPYPPELRNFGNYGPRAIGRLRVSFFAVKHIEAEPEALCKSAMSSICRMVADLRIERQLLEILE